MSTSRVIHRGDYPLMLARFRGTRANFNAQHTPTVRTRLYELMGVKPSGPGNAPLFVRDLVTFLTVLEDLRLQGHVEGVLVRLLWNAQEGAYRWVDQDEPADVSLDLTAKPTVYIRSGVRVEPDMGLLKRTKTAVEPLNAALPEGQRLESTRRTRKAVPETDTPEAGTRA